MAFSKESALNLLLSTYEEGRLAHAHLFTGAVGSGKSWLAEHLAARLLGCDPHTVETHPDAHFLGPESKSRKIVIDPIRELEHTLHQKPLLGNNKVAIISDVDRLQPSAANAFLKTLEEPPSGTFIILTTPLPEEVLETIISRCLLIALQGTPAIPSEDSRRVMEAFSSALLDTPAPTVATAFRFARTLQETLNRIRERVTGEHQALLKDESRRYKDVMDKDAFSHWLEERENQIKALSEATAIRERNHLLQAVFEILGDVLRVQQGLPALLPSSEQIAKRYSPEEIFSRIDAWEEMRRRLSISINEPLMLETGALAMVIA